MEIVLQILIGTLAIAGSILVGDLRIASYILGIGLILVVLVSVFAKLRQEKRIEELTMYLMRLQDQLALPELTKYDEGRLGILENEIYKLVVLIREQSEGAIREKEYLAKMLSDISHQIKTPLSSVMIMTDLLKNPELPDEDRIAFTEKIDSQVNRINWLIRNLLTLSQLDANMLKLKKEEVTIEQLVRKSCQPLEILAELRGIKLHASYCSDLQIVCDERWTAEALSNIIKNCIEHTAQGGQIEITANQNNFATSIIIKDDGEGIGKEHLPHIFDRFYRADHAADDSVGIGLALSKQIIMMQNGMIHVESEKGTGTVFHIRIYSGVVI